MKKKICVVVLIFAMLFGLASCGETKFSSIGVVPDEKSIHISIAMCGDVMAHMPQLNAAEQADGSYDFSDNYSYVSSIMSDADLCMANVECTFPGGDYTGYPAFRTPDSLAGALKNAGVDIGIFANNHMNDSGLDGAKRTVEVLQDAGLKVVGCRTNTDQNRSIVYQLVKDGEVINIGVVAYAYETSRGDTNRTMNGGAMRSDAVDYYNTFRQYADTSYLNLDIENIKAEVKWCQDRSDITIVYLHWGDEYQRHSNARQEYIAEKIAEAKPDAIVASHPHVIQEISYVNDVPVYYSIGNYISNQRAETLDNHYTEQGLIAMLDFDLVSYPVDDGSYVIAKDGEEISINVLESAKHDGNVSGYKVYGTSFELKAEDEYNHKLFKIFAKKPKKADMDWYSWSKWETQLCEAKAVPTWVNKYRDANGIRFVIIPLISGFENNESLVKAGYVNRAKDALADIKDLIGEEFIWNLK